eukprot:1842400-Rhodomonas_salina.1
MSETKAEQCMKITFAKQYGLPVKGALQFANAVLEDTQFTSAAASEDGGIYGTSIIDDQVVIYGEKATMMKVGRRLPDITAASETPLCAELDEGSTE